LSIKGENPFFDFSGIVDQRVRIVGSLIFENRQSKAYIYPTLIHASSEFPKKENLPTKLFNFGHGSA
jgi:hypothetical protein